MKLATPFPRMDAEARLRVEQCLAGGCRTMSCKSDTATLVLRLVGGSVVVHLQCDGCGKSLAGALSRKLHYQFQSYPKWDDAKGDAFWEAQKVASLRRNAGLATTIQQERHTVADDYSRWLRTSPEWSRTSDSVKKRANYTCEACLNAHAEVVHHLTYALGALPPAWELKAVCRRCHDRLHADKHGATDEWCRVAPAIRLVR